MIEIFRVNDVLTLELHDIIDRIASLVAGSCVYEVRFEDLRDSNIESVVTNFCTQADVPMELAETNLHVEFVEIDLLLIDWPNLLNEERAVVNGTDVVPEEIELDERYNVLKENAATDSGQKLQKKNRKEAERCSGPKGLGRIVLAPK